MMIFEIINTLGRRMYVDPDKASADHCDERKPEWDLCDQRLDTMWNRRYAAEICCDRYNGYIQKEQGRIIDCVGDGLCPFVKAVKLLQWFRCQNSGQIGMKNACCASRNCRNKLLCIT